MLFKNQAVDQEYTEGGEKKEINFMTETDIRTTNAEPIYTKSHLRGKVEQQVTQLLNNGVIRP